MRRATTLIAGVLAVALVWALTDRAGLRSDLAAVQKRLDETYDELAGTRAAHRVALQEVDDSTEEAKRFRRRARRFAEEASSRRLELRRRSAIDHALAPGQEVYRARVLRGGEHDLLVVEWRDRDDTRSGVYVWRVNETSMELTYVVEPKVSFESAEAGYVLTGPPGAATEDRYGAWIQWAGVSDSGDATGDGLPDLALSESGSGTGGCGKVRLLQNLGGTFRETYQHEDCNHSIEIAGGRLVHSTAAHPKGCDQIHGCGEVRTRMRWSGTTWVVEKVTRDP